GMWEDRVMGAPGPRYIMLYKPADFVCSHEDGYNQTAFALLDEPKIENLHFAGRLDVDTTGLVLITDDGKWSHRITSPKHKRE
ncbi:16S rRNA pseudouridine(516) synthase, partial [Vibrio sp. Vb2880]|uniref:pseudouridine synthase n=1 Tax=Vibrio sp. Vb2880 TaxID=2816076 RepID=UPI001AC1E71E